MNYENINEKYCRRIDKHVRADTLEDSGRVFIVCKYYTSDSYCTLNPTREKKLSC
jgi:hypothetical protein